MTEKEKLREFIENLTHEEIATLVSNASIMSLLAQAPLPSYPQEHSSKKK